MNQRVHLKLSRRRSTSVSHLSIPTQIGHGQGDGQCVRRYSECSSRTEKWKEAVTPISITERAPQLMIAKIMLSRLLRDFEGTFQVLRQRQSFVCHMWIGTIETLILYSFFYRAINVNYFRKEPVAIERLPNGEVVDGGRIRTRQLHVQTSRHYPPDHRQINFVAGCWYILRIIQTLTDNTISRFRAF